MNDAKYIGLDVHQATISVAVLDSAGKLVMEAILETKTATILDFIHGLTIDCSIRPRPRFTTRQLRTSEFPISVPRKRRADKSLRYSS